ncbi:MAG: hypothetical protein KA712_03085 [Myxococcales bacterium]|nr:hypothetical protein [Myxococcales bacterium]
MEIRDSLESFFHAHIDRAMKHEGVSADPMTEHYLVVLLTGFAAAPIDDKPLALKMLGTLDLAPRQRRDQLRDIGDTSLYVSGFWAESLQRGPVDVDYYIGIGESAYGQLAHRTPLAAGDPFVKVFADLAINFPRFVRVLAAISEMVNTEAGPKDIVRLYERWTRTGSRWARNRLAKLGVSLPDRANVGAAAKLQ